jgi:hypothetical protein
MTEQTNERQLSRSETHDLSMIIKDRTKVLRAHAEAQAAACLADFERKLATIYSWDQDETWKKAVEVAEAEVQRARDVIRKRCEEVGVPQRFAPDLTLVWSGRGENALKSRRDELTRVAKTTIDAMVKGAITKIERQALDLRTQVVAMAILSSEAKLFLESLAPIEESMRVLDFAEVEHKLENEKTQMRQLYRRSYGDD